MTESMTLAIDVDALERLTDPPTAIDESKDFAAHVGVISPGMGFQSATRIRHLGVSDVDFLTRVDREGGLAQVMSATDTDRYVYVGTDVTDAELAIATGWEYLDVEVAADEADWDVR